MPSALQFHVEPQVTETGFSDVNASDAVFGVACHVACHAETCDQLEFRRARFGLGFAYGSIAGTRSYCPSAQRYSVVTFWPSI